MASSMSYVEFVMEQLAGAGTITCRRMFGEYGLYCDGKYFACVCNDRLLVKITARRGRRCCRTAPGASPTRAAGRCSCRTWRTGRR